MGPLKKINFTLILLTFLFCCDSTNLVKREVDIYDSTIPAIGTINQDIQIHLKAQATNGCYSDLEIRLIKIDSKHFLFKATGLFQTNSVCPDMMVYKDTIINFRAASPGDYYFQTNQDPFEIRKDTIEIN